MPELNRANRQVCDVDIRILKTMAPFLNFDTANTTTAGLTGDSVYAMAKGSRRIAFPNPLEGTMTIEAQVYPFKFFALLSNGNVTADAVYADHQTVKATAAGGLDVIPPFGGSILAGSVFVYPADSYCDELSMIEGTFEGIHFTASDESDIEADTEYVVGYMVSRTDGVKRISFNNKNLPNDYFITMTTLDKDEQGVFTPFVITAYKASIQRTFELSFSSEGDPATVTLTFDLMEDKDGNILDMVELTSDVESDSTENGATRMKMKSQDEEAGYGTKKVSELMGEDVKVTWNGTDGVVTGTFKKVTDWTDLPHDPRDGHFFALTLDDKYKGKSFDYLKDGVVTNHTDSAGDDEMFWIIRLEDASIFEFRSNGETIVRLDFSHATLSDE